MRGSPARTASASLCGQEDAVHAHHWAVDYPPAKKTAADDLNELIREGNAENAARRALHSRATAAHYAANRVALDALGRAGRTLSTAAGRLTDDYYPATRAAEVTREAAALDRAVAAAADPEVSNDRDRTDAALDGLHS